MSYFIRYNMLIMSGFFIAIALFLYNASAVASEKYAEFLIQGAAFLDNVLVYIAALEILKSALSQRRVFAGLQYRPSEFSYHQTRLLALISAFPFGLGVSSFLKGLSKEDINTKPISEGMTASMLIYPTTLASGFVFDSFGLSSLAMLFLFGLPIVVFVLLRSFKGLPATLTTSSLFRVTATLGICNYIYLFTLSQFIPHHFMLKQAAFFVLIALAINIRVIPRIPHILWNARNSFIFFICVGVLGHSFINWSGNLDIMVNAKWFNIYVAVAVPIFVIPLLSILFIHPLVLFLIFNPLLSPYLQTLGVNESGLYAIWVVMLINAQLLSPVSLTTVLSVSNSNSNIFSESFLKHGRYSMIVSCLAYFYILMMLSWG